MQEQSKKVQTNFKCALKKWLKILRSLKIYATVPLNDPKLNKCFSKRVAKRVASKILAL